MLSAYMQLAVQQALRGGPATYQNPQVGAVLVKGGRVISQGYHHRFGGNHAEVDCLTKVSPQQAVGATLYVTLEPCCHVGKTPACSQRIIQAGIKHVVIGQLDPHKIVAGKGRNDLLAHGVKVTQESGVAIENLNRHYNWFYRHQRPWITLKTAQTLDGKINAQVGTRSRLSQEAAQRDSQQLRSRHHAILVGERTLTTDDPQLTVRLRALAHPPVRLVTVNRSAVAVGKQIVTDPSAETWLLARQADAADSSFAANVHVVVGDWTPAAIADFCAQHGWQSLLVEGGSHLQAQFVASGLVEAWVSYISPQLWGGTALPAVADSKLAPTSLQFEPVTVTQLGADLRLVAYRTGVA